MNTINLSCPNCNAPLKFDIDTLKCSCPYCGKDVSLDSKTLADVLRERERTQQRLSDNKTKEYIVRNEERTRRLTRFLTFLKKPEILWISIFGLVLLFTLILYGFQAYFSRPKIPISSKEAIGQNYISVCNTLKSAGFTNFSIYMEDDEKYLRKYEKDDVVKISIDGKKSFSSGKRFDKNDVIQVHVLNPGKKVNLPVSSNSISRKNVNELKTLLQSYGFNNVQLKEVTGLLNGIVYDEKEVTKMTVDGKSRFTEGAEYDPDVPILISYYSSS